MSIIPRSIPELVAFCEEHIPLWIASPASVGLSASQVAQLSSDLNTLTAAVTSRGQAANAAKAATIVQGTSADEVRATLADCIRSIKTYAEAQAKPGEVYAAAQIPPPATPSPVPPPGTPTDFRAALNPDGSLTIAWACANPRGAGPTVYHIRRRIGAGAWETVGSSGSRRYTDTTLSGGTSVAYEVRAQRGEAFGLASSPFTVQFGTAGDALTITGQYEGTARLAA